MRGELGRAVAAGKVADGRGRPVSKRRQGQVVIHVLAALGLPESDPELCATVGSIIQDGIDARELAALAFIELVEVGRDIDACSKDQDVAAFRRVRMGLIETLRKLIEVDDPSGGGPINVNLVFGDQVFGDRTSQGGDQIEIG